MYSIPSRRHDVFDNELRSGGPLLTGNRRVYKRVNFRVKIEKKNTIVVGGGGVCSVSATEMEYREKSCTQDVTPGGGPAVYCSSGRACVLGDKCVAEVVSRKPNCLHRE